MAKNNNQTLDDIANNLSIEAINEYNRLSSLCPGPFPFLHAFSDKGIVNNLILYEDKTWMWSLPASSVFKYSILYQHGTIRIGTFDPHRKLQGIGYIKIPNTLQYEGEFLNDLFHGTGSCKYDNNSINYCESAQWTNGQPVGIVTIIYSNKDIYTGDYYDNQPHGNGTIKLHTKITYIGNFSHGDATGNGIIYYNNGDIYSGQCAKCLPHGFGTILYTNGDSFKGKWIHGIQQQRDLALADLIISPIKKKKNRSHSYKTLSLSSFSDLVIQNAIDKILIIKSALDDKL